jgi:hypothetical protein
MVEEKPKDMLFDLEAEMQSPTTTNSSGGVSMTMPLPNNEIIQPSNVINVNTSNSASVTDIALPIQVSGLINQMSTTEATFVATETAVQTNDEDTTILTTGPILPIDVSGLIDDMSTTNNIIVATETAAETNDEDTTIPTTFIPPNPVSSSRKRKTAQ